MKSLKRFDQDCRLIVKLTVLLTVFVVNVTELRYRFVSFLDDAFRKNLESALRFGNPLLVQVRSEIFFLNHSKCHILVVCLVEWKFSFLLEKQRNFADQSQQRKIRHLTNQNLRQTFSPRKAREKSGRPQSNSYWFCFSLVAKVDRDILAIKKAF